MIKNKKKFNSKYLDDFQIFLEKSGKSLRTAKIYSAWALKLILFAKKQECSWVHPSKIKQKHADVFMVSMKDLPASTKNQARSALKSFFVFSGNDLNVIGPRKLPQHIPTILSWNEGALICNNAKNMRLLAWVVFGGGERLSEAVTLRCEDVIVQTPGVFLRGWRTFIPSELCQYFINHKQMVKQYHKEYASGEDWFFPVMQRPTKHISPESFLNSLRHIDISNLGIMKEVTALTLFHSFCAIAFEQGKTFPWVYQRTGYKTTKTLEAIKWSVDVSNMNRDVLL
jgi:site-specific recombinase XerD